MFRKKPVADAEAPEAPGPPAASIEFPDLAH